MCAHVDQSYGRFANVAPSRSLRGFSEEDVGALGRAHCFLRCSKLELRWRGEMRTAWVCSASLLDHLLSNTHVIVFVKPVLSSLEVGA